MKGSSCVRHGEALASVEAPSANAPVENALDLYPPGDWTDEPRALVVFPQDDYPHNAGRHDYTQAGLRADPSFRRPRASPGHRDYRYPVGQISYRWLHA